MATEPALSTVWECLETPGIAVTRFGPNATRSVRTDVLHSGLLAAVDVVDRPTHVFYDAAFIDQFYSAVKQDLHQQHPLLTHLRPSSDLSLYMSYKRLRHPRMVHTAEVDCVNMDLVDLVRPTLEAVSAIEAAIGPSRSLEAAVSTVNPLIDLAIYEVDSATNISVGPRLVVFEHKSVAVASTLHHFADCTQFATPSGRLNYVGARSGTDKANTILVKLGLYMARDKVRFGILSDHEHLVFCEILKHPDWPETSCPVLRLSRVYPCTQTDPTVSSTLAALLLMVFGTTQAKLPRLLKVGRLITPQETIEEASSEAIAGSTIEGRDADSGLRRSGRIAAAGKPVRYLDPGVESSAQIKSLFFTFDYVGKPDAPLYVDEAAFDDYAVHKRRPYAPAHQPRMPMTWTLAPAARISPATSEDSETRSNASSSNSFDDSSPDTSLDTSSEPQGFVSCFRLRALGSTSTVLQLHGTRVVAKWFGPSEGHPDPERGADQWRTDFETERQVYETALRPLWGSVVPRYLGAFEPTGGKPNDAFLLLEDAGHPIVETHGFDDVPLGTRKAILDLLLQLAAVGVFTNDIAPRNVLVSPEGNMKIIDFGRVAQDALPEDRTEWLQYAAKELALPSSDVEARAAALGWQF